MALVRNPIVVAVERFASGLRFPKLLVLMGGLFLVDLVIPDVIPLVDEMLLALITLVLANLRSKRRTAEQVS